MTEEDVETELPLNTRAGLVRTRLAFERTLMAWIRTAISLVTFGFALYKGFEYAIEARLIKTQGLVGPRVLAVLMISLGLAALVLATIQHLRHVNMLHRMFGKLPVFSIGSIIAILFAALGVFALFDVILRL